MAKTVEQQAPETFTIEQSRENPEKWFIQHKILGKGYLLRDGTVGQMTRHRLGRDGDFTHYHDSKEMATDFALAMERIPERKVCQKCGRPFATIHDVRATQLFGLCPTQYAPRDPDAAKDCERNVLKAGNSGMSLTHLFAYVQAMIRENVSHKTKHFRLGDMSWQDQCSHLRDECGEVSLATTPEDKKMELADALGVLVHMCCELKMTREELLALCLHKLALRFEIPKSVDRAFVAVDMGKPGGDYSVHYTINTETLEIEDVTGAVEAAEEECLKDEFTGILYRNVIGLDVFTASAAAMLAKAYYNIKHKEEKSGKDPGTQSAV
jgi:hypothetical protein